MGGVSSLTTVAGALKQIYYDDYVTSIYSLRHALMPYYGMVPFEGNRDLAFVRQALLECLCDT